MVLLLRHVKLMFKIDGGLKTDQIVDKIMGA